LTEAYPAELFRLDGKCALVTGARQGIGRTIAAALARAGADVAITSRTAGELDATVEEVRAHGRRAAPLGLDLTDAGDVDATIARSVDELGRLDIVVNNAGVTARAPAIELTNDEWNTVIATNLTGTFLMCRAAARVMHETGGRIINLSSTFARVPAPNRAAYAASKAGVEQLTRVLAQEWAPSITVNAIAPTTVVTETRADLFSDRGVREARTAEIPMGRLSTADDLVGAVLLLAGAAGGFITGQTLVVDGGFSLG
jgi:NAD(P)-dependent dehydrogenase (short-subunit alcohol dehydrogenase family)